MIEIVKESKKENPNFNSVKSRVYDQWVNNEIILKSKEKAKIAILEKNNKLSVQETIKRNEQKLEPLVQIL